MRLSGARLSINLAPSSVLLKIFCYPVAINLPSNAVPVNHQISVIKNDSSISSFSILNRTNPSQALFFMAYEGRNSNPDGCYKSKCSLDSLEKQVSCREINDDDFPQNLDKENNKESQRRRRIGLANKGKMPWNKGKKHNLETRERIKQRTIEALSDPKVRRKMSEYPRTHSDQVKVKISFSLRRVWGKRLMKKRLNKKFFLLWRESIAVAAKKGGKEEEELDWDSYDKIKQEMLHQKLQWAAEKAKLKQIRAENAEKRRVERMLRKEEKGDGNGKLKRMKMRSKGINGQKRKAKEEEDNPEMKLTAIERSKLKQRLKSIRKKISKNGVVAAQRRASVISQNTSWGKLDLDLMKKCQMRKEVSLADQIQVAKTRKADSIACKVLLSSTPTYQRTGRAEK